MRLQSRQVTTAEVLVWNGKQSVERVGDSGLSSELTTLAAGRLSEETTDAASTCWPVESREQTGAE